MTDERRDFYGYYILPEKLLVPLPDVENGLTNTDLKKHYETIAQEYDDENIGIRISVDGFLHIEIKEKIQTLDELDKKDNEAVGPVRGYFDLTVEYIKYLNALQLFIANEYTKSIDGITHMNQFQIQKLDNMNVVRYAYNQQGTEIDAKMSTYTKVLLEARFGIGLRNGIPLSMQSSLLMKTSLNLSVIQQAFEKFATVASDEIKINILSHACNSICEYKEGNFAQSFILSRFFIESYIVDNVRKPYLDSLNNNEPGKISQIRKKILSGGSNQFSISGVIEILELHSVITKDEYDKLTELRKLRNKLIHGFVKNQNISEHEAKEAINKMLEYIGNIIGQKLGFNDGLHLINYSTSSISKRV